MNIHWPAGGIESVVNSLNDHGFAHVKDVVSARDCRTLIDLYEDNDRFRKTIDMKRYRFGDGQYKYFDYPLPPLVESLRTAFYGVLWETANHWMSILGQGIRYPAGHNQFLNRCHDHQQQRATPLILRYESGGHNTLHQDLYGEVFFPLQVVILLSQSGEDFNGGEFVLTQQIPRAQSRASVIQPDRGDAVIFTTNFRPVKGSRGHYRATMKHGVSEVKSGVRYTLGIIFHDAA